MILKGEKGSNGELNSIVKTRQFMTFCKSHAQIDHWDFFVPLLWCTFFNHLSPITLARFEDKQDNTATRQHNQTNTGSVWDTLDNGHHSQLIFKCKEDHLKMINKLMASVWNSRKMAKMKKKHY